MLARVKRESLDICWFNSIADEASGCMSVEAEHKEEGKMVSVPKGLEGLIPDFGLSGGIH
jgi:hypothetical protein